MRRIKAGIAGLAAGAITLVPVTGIHAFAEIPDLATSAVERAEALDQSRADEATALLESAKNRKDKNSQSDRADIRSQISELRGELAVARSDIRTYRAELKEVKALALAEAVQTVTGSERLTQENLARLLSVTNVKALRALKNEGILTPKQVKEVYQAVSTAVKESGLPAEIKKSRKDLRNVKSEVVSVKKDLRSTM